MLEQVWREIKRGKRGGWLYPVLALPDRIAFPADGREISNARECTNTSYIYYLPIYTCVCVCVRKCICKRNVNVTGEETEPRDACRARRAPA